MNRRFIAISAALLWVAIISAATATTPQYQIYDIGVIDVGDDASQGFGVSHGGIAVGRSIRTGGSQAFSWTIKAASLGCRILRGAVTQSRTARLTDLVVGTAATTLFGSESVAGHVAKWRGFPVTVAAGRDARRRELSEHFRCCGRLCGCRKQPAGRNLHSAAAVRSLRKPHRPDVFSSLHSASTTQQRRVVGQGIDPNNAARNVGIVYDIGDNDAFEVGALPGLNGALAFGVSNTGYVVGSSMLNQGSGLPFIWSDQGGIVAIPLATGTSEGSARAVNSAGWVVGNDSSAFSIPFLYDGTNTYRLADLIPPGSGWDLSMNTSSSADGISEDGIIVGTGVHNGETHAYAMVPVAPSPTPTPTPTATPTNNSDTCAKSYSYTKGAPDSATATVIGTVEAGVSPA